MQICTSLRAFGLFLALAGCGESKPERKLEVTKLEIVPSKDRPNQILEVRVHTIDGAYVQLDPPFPVPGDGTAGYLSGNPKNGVIVFEIPMSELGTTPVEADLKLTHHELKGAKVEMKVKLQREAGLEAHYKGPQMSNELRCGGIECNVREASGDPFRVSIAAPAGTKVDVAGATGEVVGARALEVAPDLGPRLAELPMGELTNTNSRLTVDLPVALTLPDGKALTGTLSLGLVSVRRHAMALLAQVTDGPVQIAGDTEAAAPKRDSLLFVKRMGASDFVVAAFKGDAQTKLAEVDVIAVRTPTGERERSCGTYVGPSGEKASFGVTMYDNDVTVYDRRTGAKLGHKSFPAPQGQCPSTIDRQARGASQTSEVEWPVMRDFAYKTAGF